MLSSKNEIIALTAPAVEVQGLGLSKCNKSMLVRRPIGRTMEC